MKKSLPTKKKNEKKIGKKKCMPLVKIDIYIYYI